MRYGSRVSDDGTDAQGQVTCLRSLSLERQDKNANAKGLVQVIELIQAGPPHSKPRAQANSQCPSRVPQVESKEMVVWYLCLLNPLPTANK